MPDAGFNVLGMTGTGYAETCARLGRPGGHAGALDRYRRLFRDGEAADPLLLPEGGKLTPPPVATRLVSQSDEGEVVKFTSTVAGASGSQATHETLETESVVIPMIGRKGVLTHTLCVSSQVGCAMGCTFCQTAQMGLVRNLTPAEIVAQWFNARHVIGCETITNIVFMGMGEPMDNLDAVMRAIEIFADHNGPSVNMSKITVSTVGRLDGIARLAERVQTPGWHRLGLAISLNAPNDEIRSSIMPVNRGMPMAELREAVEAWPIYGASKICFEYVLIPGVNDGPEHATELASWVRGLPGLVNVIPYNPRDDSPWPAPREEDVDAFVRWLTDEDIYVKRRRTKGRDTMAACGQLGNPALRTRHKPKHLRDVTIRSS